MNPNDFDQWEEENAAQQRAEADAEDKNPSYQARLKAKRAAEAARNARSAAQYQADKAEAIDRGEWLEDKDEE